MDIRLQCLDWKYKDYLDQKTIKEESHRELYTHKLVRRAYIHIKKALPDMSYFLDNPRIPKTTNALESFFVASTIK